MEMVAIGAQSDPQALRDLANPPRLTWRRQQMWPGDDEVCTLITLR